MKKRRILLGLALAATAVFSLASCGDKETDTGSSTTPATVSTTTPATATPSTATPSTATPSSAEKSEDPVATEYTVKFVDADGTTELSSVKVAEGETVAKPTKPTAPAGKRFDYWADADDTPVNFADSISEDVTYKAVYTDTNEYDELAASTDAILTADFYDTDLGATDLATYSSGISGVKGFNYLINTPKGTEESKVRLQNKVNTTNQLHLMNANVAGDFGTSYSTGVVTMYFEMNTTALNTEAFAQFNGDSANDKSNTEVFGLRTDSTGVLKYRFDGGNDVSTNVTLAANTNYALKVVIDMTEGTASIYCNGTAVVENITSEITSVNGVKFTCKDTGATEKTIDNVAILYKLTQKSPLKVAKENAIAELEAYKTGATYTAYDAVVKAMVDERYATSEAAINAATTTDEVTAAKTAWDTYAAKAKYLVTVHAYTAADTAATDAADYKVACVEGDTVNLSGVSFSGYKLNGIYSASDLSGLKTVSVTPSADTELYASVAVATLKTDSYTTASTTWTCDAKAADVECAANSTTYNCVLIKAKTLTSPTFTDSFTSCTVAINGWTTGSSNSLEYVQITAYNAAGTAIGTATAFTPAGKTYGAFTTTAGGTTTDITLNASEAISYITITNASAYSSKSFYVVTASVSYWA